MGPQATQLVQADFSAALLAQPETAGRARLIAQEVARYLGAAVIVYLLDTEAQVWIPKATAGDVVVEAATVPRQNLTLGIMADRGETAVFSGEELVRECYMHLRIRRTVVSLACIPLALDGKTLIGGIECVAYEQPITSEMLEKVAAIVPHASVALAAALAQESERNASLASITRLTQLYDIEKVFNSTLEMDDLLPIIAEKIRDVLEVQAVNLWLVEVGDRLQLVGRAGLDATVVDNMLQSPGEGIATEVSESGEALIVQAPDERLARRNTGVERGNGKAAAAITAVAAVPIMQGESLVGVIEACKTVEGAAFNDDDLFFLANLAEAAAGALHNASLLLAERKMEILETLVEVSKDISSTLDLDRVLATIVNGPATVIPYDRAAIALQQHGRLRLKAVSGEAAVEMRDAKVAALGEMLEWVGLCDEPVQVTQRGDELDTTRPEEEARFRQYFDGTGSRGFYALPLADDEGRVGVLSFESSDPDFLSRAHVEMISVLAAQATVALRNAQLYHEVPFINVLEPLIQKKQKFMALEKRRRRFLAGAAIAAAMFLALFPIPMRVQGTATVAPMRRALVQPEMAGVLRQVQVKEGQWVRQGDVLATLEDWSYRAALAAAEARYNSAMADVNRALAVNDTSEAAIQRSQANY